MVFGRWRKVRAGGRRVCFLLARGGADGFWWFGGGCELGGWFPWSGWCLFMSGLVDDRTRESMGVE